MNDLNDEPLPLRAVPPRVLVADDNKLIRRITEALLISCGARVSLACNGIEALEQMATSSFDVALLDMRMPFVGGLQIVSTARASPHDYKRLPTFVGMSASPSNDLLELCHQAGMSDFLCKPICKSDLDKGLVRWCYLAQRWMLDELEIARGGRGVEQLTR